MTARPHIQQQRWDTMMYSVLPIHTGPSAIAAYEVCTVLGFYLPFSTCFLRWTGVMGLFYRDTLHRLDLSNNGRCV